MRSSRFLSAILVLAAVSSCEEKKPRYLDDGKDKTGAKVLASNAFIPPVSCSPQGAWRVTHVDGKPFDGGRIAFAKGWLSYSGGCNGAGGEYVSRPDGRLEIKNTSGHAVACYDADGGESGMALDDLIGERLGRTMKFHLSTRDDLLLTRPDGRSLRMKRLSRPPRSVEGDWALLNGGWNPRVGLDPRPTAHFHRGRYHDAVGCDCPRARRRRFSRCGPMARPARPWPRQGDLDLPDRAEGKTAPARRAALDLPGELHDRPAVRSDPPAVALSDLHEGPAA